MRGTCELCLGGWARAGAGRPLHRNGARRLFPRRRGARYLLGAAVAVVVGVVAGPFVFFHIVEGPAAPPLSLPTARAAGAAGINGTWLVSKGSEAEYRVHEFLFGQSGVAVGSTTHVSGEVVIEGNTLTKAVVSVDMRSVTTNMAGRNVMFHEAIMDTPAYPYGTFTLTRPVRLGNPPAPGRAVRVSAVGDLELRGYRRVVTFPLTAERVGGGIYVEGNLQIRYGLWHIPNPSFAVARVANTGAIEVLLYLRKAA
jgi:polyisoprenoid-binding protein YceI